MRKWCVGLLLIAMAEICHGQSDSLMYAKATNYILKSKKVKRHCRRAFFRLFPQFSLSDELRDGFNITYLEKTVEKDTSLVKSLNNYPVYSKSDTIVDFPFFKSLEKSFNQSGRCSVSFSKPYGNVMKIQINELRGKERDLDEFIIVLGLFVFDEKLNIRSFYIRTIHAG